MALIANCNRDPKARRDPYAPRDFVPPELLREEAAPPPPVADISILKVFLPKKG